MSLPTIPVYVESDPNCNMLTFQLGTTGLGTALVGRQWSIKVGKNLLRLEGND